MHAPLILLDKDSDFHIIRFSIAYMSIMDCPPDESANNNAIPLTLSFLIAGLFLLCFSLKNVHLLSKRNIVLTLVAATMGAAAMCLYNDLATNRK